MKRFRGALVYLMRLFSSVEQSEMNLLPVYPYLRSPPASQFVKIDTAKAGLISAWRSRIFHVLTLAGKPKIVPLIVPGISVPVVYLSGRPSACHISPNESMDFVVGIHETDYGSTAFGFFTVSSYSANFNLLRSRYFPTKYAGFWIVMKMLANECRIKFFHGFYSNSTGRIFQDGAI